MTFLNAWAAGFLAIAPVIVLLYLLKLNRRPVAVSTLMFWQRVLQENRRRAFFQRLRQLFSLLLHLFIFALMLAALAKPTWDRFVRDGSSTVLVIDTRARMQAMEGGESRFAKAKAAALRLASQANGRRQFALVTGNSSARVLAPFSGDERYLREGIAGLAATDAPGDLAPALKLADDLLSARRGERQIVLLTDSAPGNSALRTAHSEVRTIAVGTAQDNVAITRLAARPLLNSPQTSEVLLELENFGAVQARGNVEIQFDGRTLDVRPFALAPGARQQEIFPSVSRVRSGARGWLTARIDAPDAFATDNVAFAVLPVPPVRRVLLVSAGNFFLEKLLSVDAAVKFQLVAPEAWQAALAEKFDVVIFDNALPPGFALAEAPGNFLFIRRSPFDQPGDAIAQPLVSDMDETHPALRLVNLQNVTVVRAAPMRQPADADGWSWQAPIRSFENPLLITGAQRSPTGERRAAALAFDVAESDLPLRVAFPLLISQTIQWLAGDAVERSASAIAGQPIVLAAGETVWTEPQTQIVRDAKLDPARMARGFFQPEKNGYYLVQGGNAQRWIAVNGFGGAESNLRAVVASGAVDAPEPVAGFSSAVQWVWPPWMYCALGAFALFVVEWWLFHRRRTE